MISLARQTMIKLMSDQELAIATMTGPVRNRLVALLNIHRAVRLVWTAAPKWTLFNLLLVLVQGVLPLASLVLLKQVVDALGVAITAGAGAEFSPVALWIALLGLVAVATSLVGSCSNLVNEAHGLAVTDHVADILHEKSVAVDLGYYEDPSFHDTLHLAQQEAPYRPARIVNGLTQLLQSLLLLIGIVSLLFAFHWAVGLALLAAALPAGVMRLITARQRFGYEQSQVEAERRAWYYHVVMTSLEFAREIRLFGLGRLFVGRYHELRDGLRRGRLALSARRTRYELVTQVLATLALYATLAVMAWFSVRGSMTLGVVVMYFQGYQRAQAALQNLLQGLGHLYEDNLFLRHFYAFVDLPDGVEMGGLETLPEAAETGLVCDKVRFAYPGMNRPVLDDIDLQIRPGEVVALVGANGAGKTTLAKLLCRLYDPQQGSISWERQDLRATSAATWRRQVSVVNQDVVCFDLSIAENIALGDVDRAADPDDLMLAAGQAGASDLIRRSPEGLETRLGLQFESGRELSIGERQRLSLARACFRQAGLLIMDEPSSALDPIGEAELIRSFRGLLDGRSALIISHRMSTVQMADRIYVIDAGRIVEQGTHAELLGRQGHYARLYRAQSELYRP